MSRDFKMRHLVKNFCSSFFFFFFFFKNSFHMKESIGLFSGGLNASQVQSALDY